MTARIKGEYWNKITHIECVHISAKIIAYLVIILNNGVFAGNGADFLLILKTDYLASKK